MAENRLLVIDDGPANTGAARALADAGDLKSVTALAKPVSLAVLREALQS